MTIHDRDKIIALREEADKFATNELSCEGEYHPDFHTVSDERFYAIAFEAGRQAEREECAKYIENQSLPDAYSEPCLAWFAEDIRARGEVK
jgi:hypothetical protein